MPHILVVEDDPQLRAALLRALEERGYATSWSHTGMAGLDQAVRDRPDLVVVDLGLPDVDGHQVLRMLRAVSAVPVIVATAREEEQEIVRALDAGADTFIFLSAAHSTAAKTDEIEDFSRKDGDHIDVSKVADFDFIGKAKFSGGGAELNYQVKGDETFLYGDTNGDKKADFVVRLDGKFTLVEGDFIL